MSIFIGQLVGFGIVVLVFVKYILPVLRKTIAKQQETIAEQEAESERAKAKLAEAKDAHANALEQARAEASRIREEARGDSQAITEQMRVQADKEVKRISEHGKAQVELNRQNLVRQLRGELGIASLDVAAKLVREHLEDPAAKSDSVDRAISELEGMAGDEESFDTTPASETVGTRSMRAVSRDSVRSLARGFDEKASSLDDATLHTVAEDLSSVAALLVTNPVLRKHLSENADSTDPKVALVDSLFSGKVAGATLDVLKNAVAAKWSTAGDFSTAIERLSRLALLTVADRDGKISEVEDELFRLGRLLIAEPELTRLLSDYHTPVEGRIQLVDNVIGGKVTDHTKALVANAVRLQHGLTPIDVAIGDIAELAAARRGESVAHVIAASELTDAQTERLSAVLGRIYRREMSVQTEIDPQLLGGLKVLVADELIEGDIASRLTKASESLPK
ncbi:F-type H+-transporting ATPase subunit delta [Williamsia limnetica]|jgi:F-type H+-transporting ATPase subunit delta|uniref:Multifunctional fusion protein n=1 Tax=Williamsia limnetica TaxID=882452 RepID=A0A318RAF1_WILLI|nr:F0F1 ATP synthase subunit B/delta [Williamsia limnetica]PYE12645.1 F-type H+-transporting ATPase subunit delta [Williamsia limnetica]